MLTQKGRADKVLFALINPTRFEQVFMARKKSKKIDFSNMEELDHKPFAGLAARFGLSPTPTQTESEPKAPKTAAQPSQPMLMVRKEKRAKGKLVTCIYHLLDNHKAVLKQLKAKLACGGSLRDEVLEVQGDRRSEVADYLLAQGYKLRLGN